ncbi:hypothetical protein TcCL_NonESM06438, partial [Trypanosoma cruzi]
TVSPASTEKALLRASVPDAESFETDRGTPPKDVDLAAPQKNPSPEEKWIRTGCPDRPRESSLGGKDRSSETEGRQDTPPTLGDDTAAAACLCCRRANTPSSCGVDGVALRGECASSCVARTQHWMPNRKKFISLGAVLHMHVLCPLRLTLCLRLVVFPMRITPPVLVADVGHHMVVWICVRVSCLCTYTYTHRCE